MQYRHIRTGVVIELSSVMNDREWELIEAPASTGKAPAPSSADVPEAEAEAPVEAPAEKTATTPKNRTRTTKK